MGLGSRLRWEEADPPAGFAVLRNHRGWEGVQPLPALLLLGRARRFARPRLRLLRLWRCWQMGPGPGVSGKGDCSFPGANLLPLERRPGLQRGFCWSRTGTGFDMRELRIQQGVLNTGESEPLMLYGLEQRRRLALPLGKHPPAVFHAPLRLFSVVLCVLMGRRGAMPHLRVWGAAGPVVARAGPPIDLIGSERQSLSKTVCFLQPGSDSGTTAVVALIRGKQLIVANAGDSRCVVSEGGKAVDMSYDHKPEDEVELARIKNAGGKVTMDGRVNGGLNLSRAIGERDGGECWRAWPQSAVLGTPVLPVLASH